MLTPRLALLALAMIAPCAPVAAQPLKDNFGDPLPEGAKARVGSARMVRPGGATEWLGAVLTLDGKFLLSSVHGGAIEKIDVTTGLIVGTIGEKDPKRWGYEYLYLSADGKRGVKASTD